MVVESSISGRWAPFAAFSLGAVVGAIAALLLMPESAADHRERMARRVDKALKLAEMNTPPEPVRRQSPERAERG